jgi:hypothetical protein
LTSGRFEAADVEDQRTGGGGFRTSLTSGHRGRSWSNFGQYVQFGTAVKDNFRHWAWCLSRRTEPGKAYGVITAKAIAVLEALLRAKLLTKPIRTCERPQGLAQMDVSAVALIRRPKSWS